MKAESKKPILDLSTKKPKCLPAWQVYSKLYYTTRIKAAVKSRWEQTKTLVDSSVLSEQPKLVSFRNAIMQELFAAESDNVKAEVEHYWKKLAIGNANNDNNGDTNQSDDTDEGVVATAYHK